MSEYRVTVRGRDRRGRAVRISRVESAADSWSLFLAYRRKFPTAHVSVDAT